MTNIREYFLSYFSGNSFIATLYSSRPAGSPEDQSMLLLHCNPSIKYLPVGDFFYIGAGRPLGQGGGAKRCPEKMGRAAAADPNLYNLAETT